MADEAAPDPESVRTVAVVGTGVIGMDYGREVTPPAAYDWDPEDRLSRRWTIVKGDGANTIAEADGQVYEKLPPVKHQIVAMTCPEIGNYGVNELDQESASPHVRGFVI
ncbi:MAG: carbamoyl-phosphate synthase small subunit, partial [Streptomyces sp.]|nr:carbamoyl-phosphate synthase small subunit [Streptomyces sp.]